MARRWPKELAWIRIVLEVEKPWCGECGRRMHVRAHGHHRILTFEGPVHLICKLMQCTDSACPNHHRTFGPAQADLDHATLDGRLGRFLLAGSSAFRSALVSTAASA